MTQTLKQTLIELLQTTIKPKLCTNYYHNLHIC